MSTITKNPELFKQIASVHNTLRVYIKIYTKLQVVYLQKIRYFRVLNPLIMQLSIYHFREKGPDIPVSIDFVSDIKYMLNVIQV